MVSYMNWGASKGYQINARVYTGASAQWRFSEKFYPTLDKRFDGELHIGCSLNHNNANMNIANSYLWTGFSKLAKRVDDLFITDIYISIDQPSSERNEYTDVQVSVGTSDYGIQYMPDLSREGILGFGWIRNFYTSNEVTDQNKLEVWNGAALLDMTDYQYGAVHNRNVAWTVQSPLHYHYDLLPVKKPLAYYHKSNGNITAHTQWALIKVVAKVKFFRRKRFWQL